ncbi:MAG: glycosyltransferase family 4 protein [Opitutaceae bacterium]|nr:glycosyltransferase family 4 protein [Opitutaceae bacterium]
MSVLISHTSVAPFVQQAARALHEAGQLDRFVTSVRWSETSRRQRFACRVANLVGFDLASQLRRRRVTELPPEKIESLPSGELLRLLVGRIDHGGRLTDLVWSRTEPAFDRAVARRLRAGIHTGVYGFEYSSLATFRRARELGIATFYDVPAPEPHFVRQLLDAETARFPSLRTPYQRHTAAREESRLARRRSEWEHADVVIAASRFTRDSFARAGRDASKVHIVPYGAPPPAPRDDALRGGSAPDAPLVFLWSGTFSIRKGAHYLLDAWRRHAFGRHARLRVFGAQGLPPELLSDLPEGIKFGGSIPREQLMAHYQSSDALIFPTLCDGFGMVATEAWSRGLPVITTDCAGAADLLKPNENGLLIRAGSSEAIAESITWCLDHRAELRAMRSSALATAAGWQWSDYRRSLAAALATHLAKSP